MLQVKRNVSEHNLKPSSQDTRTREASHAELLAEGLANTIRVDLGNNDLVLLVGERVRQLLIDGGEVLKRRACVNPTCSDAGLTHHEHTLQ